MQLEIEQKFPIADADGLRSRLKDLSATPLGTVKQEDTYYNHPARDFATTDEALRIRRSGDQVFLTYKGPKHDTAVKTRPEIELTLVEPQSWPSLLEALGFREVATVAKERSRFGLNRPPFRIEVTIDLVSEVGQFAEVEIVADESDAEAAQQAIQQLADELGLADPIRSSYLRMLLNKTHHA